MRLQRALSWWEFITRWNGSYRASRTHPTCRRYRICNDSHYLGSPLVIPCTSHRRIAARIRRLSPPKYRAVVQEMVEDVLSLLFLYPVVAAVFGRCSLASAILVAMGGWWVVVALGVQAIPLFTVPTLLKGALAATGSIGAEIQGWGNKATGRIGSRAKENYNKSNFAMARKIREQGRKISSITTRYARRCWQSDTQRSRPDKIPTVWSAPSRHISSEPSIKDEGSSR